MTGHPTHGAPDTLWVKLCNQAYQSTLAAEIGAQWGISPPGACDLKVPEEPLQLRRNIDNADTNANIARGAQHAKEIEGRGRRRTGKVPWRGEEGSGTDLWVCLVPVRVLMCSS